MSVLSRISGNVVRDLEMTRLFHRDSHDDRPTCPYSIISTEPTTTEVQAYAKSIAA